MLKAIGDVQSFRSGETERGVKFLEEAREGWAAVNYEAGVQMIDDSLSESERDKDAE